MTAVAHSSFLGSFPKDPEFDHPAGATFARDLERGLRDRTFSVEAFDSWRDCGWVVYVQVGGKPFEAYFAEYGEETQEGGWLLGGPPGKVSSYASPHELAWSDRS